MLPPLPAGFFSLPCFEVGCLTNLLVENCSRRLNHQSGQTLLFIIYIKNWQPAPIPNSIPPVVRILRKYATPTIVKAGKEINVNQMFHKYCLLSIRTISS